MKFVSRVEDDSSSDEDLREGSRTDNGEEEDDEEEIDEGDEVDDNEDFTDEKENAANKTVVQEESLVEEDNEQELVLKKSRTKKPSTQKMVDEAITELNERGGSSTEAIKKFIMNKNPDMIEKRLRLQIKRYIKGCLTDGTMVQIKRSFKLTNKHAAKEKEKQKQKFAAKRQKQMEKVKAEKEKQTVKKAATKNPGKKENLNVKAKDKAKTVETPKKENTKAKPAKKTKLYKGSDTETAESKKVEKPKSKNKISRKSINLVVNPTAPRPKSVKSAKTTTKVSKAQDDPPKLESPPVAANAAAIKASGRGKKK